MSLEVLVAPNQFFEGESDDPSLLKPTLVVLLAGIAGSLGFLVLTPKIINATPKGGKTFMTMGGVVAAVGSIFGIFIVWIIYAGIFTLVSRYFDGEGTFRDVVLLTGWGFVPKIFSGLIGGVVMYYAVQGVTFPQDPQAVQSLVKTLKNGPLLRMSGIVSLVFIVWSGFIWTFAVKHARDIDLREAGLSVLLPVLISLGWAINGLL